MRKNSYTKGYNIYKKLYKKVNKNKLFPMFCDLPEKSGLGGNRRTAYGQICRPLCPIIFGYFAGEPFNSLISLRKIFIFYKILLKKIENFVIILCRNYPFFSNKFWEFLEGSLSYNIAKIKK